MKIFKYESNDKIKKLKVIYFYIKINVILKLRKLVYFFI